MAIHDFAYKRACLHFIKFCLLFIFFCLIPIGAINRLYLLNMNLSFEWIKNNFQVLTLIVEHCLLFIWFPYLRMEQWAHWTFFFSLMINFSDVIIWIGVKLLFYSIESPLAQLSKLSLQGHFLNFNNSRLFLVVWLYLIICQVWQYLFLSNIWSIWHILLAAYWINV